jgi:SH3 domain protein
MRITQTIRLKLIIFLLMFFPFALMAGIARAETQYVSDQLIITLREGQGNEYKIIKMLKTGTPLEVIEEGEKYLKVRTESGSEGWVLKRYVSKEIPKSMIIAGLEKKIGLLNTRIEQYKEDKKSHQDELTTTKSDYNDKIGALQHKVSTISANAEQTSRDLKEMTRKYNSFLKDSKDVVHLVQERDSIKASNRELLTKNQGLRQENDELKRSQMIWWFAAGGGVFFVGWIVGKISRQKKFY